MKEFFQTIFTILKIIKKIHLFIYRVILISSSTSATAYIIQPLLDKIFINKDEHMLYMMPFIIITIYTAKGFGRYIQAYFISYIGQDITRIIRDRLFSLMY